MKLLVLLATILISTTTWAGDWSSGGGNAVVCHAIDGKIHSAELLDLYEARTLYGKVIVPSGKDVIATAKTAIGRVGLGRPDWQGTTYFPKLLEQINLNVHMLPPGNGLTPINDSSSPIVPPAGCMIVQAARYEMDDHIFINSDIWDHLDQTNKAALLVHETIYFWLRSLGEFNSIRTRKAIGLAFSDGKFESFDSAQPSNSIECRDVQSSGWPFFTFHAFREANGNVIFQFSRAGGNFMLMKTTATFDKQQFADLQSGNDNSIFTSFKSEMEQGRFAIRSTEENGKKHIYIGNDLFPNLPTSEIECTSHSLFEL